MGMAKIPEGMSWEKVAWQKKNKRKEKKRTNEMTKSKDNKKGFSHRLN